MRLHILCPNCGKAAQVYTVRHLLRALCDALGNATGVRGMFNVDALTGSLARMATRIEAVEAVLDALSLPSAPAAPVAPPSAPPPRGPRSHRASARRRVAAAAAKEAVCA